MNLKKLCYLSLLFWGLSNANYAQTSMINAGTFGVLEARQLGPGTMSGRITAIEGVSADPKILYVGTAGGGIWKTTNAGASFKPIFDKYCQSIGALAIEPTNPKIIYVGTGESNMRNSVSIGDGLYKSTDGGENWKKIGLDSTEHISKVAIDPKNTSVLYVAAPGPLWSDSPHRGLYKSEDGGKTWSKILYINEKTGVADLLLDPRDASVLYASTWEFRRTAYSFSSGGNGSGLYKSVDGGKTWKEITKGLPQKPFGRIAMAQAPSAPENLLAIVESEQTGLYISGDNGESWKPQSASLNVVSRPFYFSTLVVDPKDAKRVYRPAYSFSYSSDGGYSFTDASGDGGWVHSDHHALWINPNNTSQMYLGTDGGVYLSQDRGVTWIFLSNLPVGQFYHVAVDEETPYRIYGGLQDNGSWYAPSAVPGGISNGDWKSIYGGDGFWTIPDPLNPDFAYAEAQGGSMSRVNLKTFKALDIKPQAGKGDGKLRWNWNTPIVTGLANKSNLYTGAQYLFKSSDQGRNWERISPDLTTNDPKKQEQEKSGGISADVTSAENHTTIFTIAESPLDEKIIWVGTDDGNLQVTTDGGKTWVNTANQVAKAGIPAQAWVSSVEPSRFDKNTIYATFDHHTYGDHQTYVAKSTDLGQTWVSFKSPEFSGFAHKIKEDLVRPDLLFLGTEMGLFTSFDGGKTWNRMKNNIPWYVLVRDIAIHPKTHDLVLGTHGRGIIVVDDISTMRSLTEKEAGQAAVFLSAAPFPISDGAFFGGSFPATGGWVAPNAPGIKPIFYYLKDRPSTGEFSIEILDEQGKLVQKLSNPSKRKGLNKAFWNLKMEPPKTAKGSKIDFATFTAPAVLPGDYTVKMIKGNEVITQKIQLIHDEANTSFSLEDRKARHALSMQLYELHRELAVLVDQLIAEEEVLHKMVAEVKKPAHREILSQSAKSLYQLRETLVPIEMKSMFADIRRLREDISEVYVAVCSNDSKPSNLQEMRTKDLNEEIKKATDTFSSIKSKYVPVLNKIGPKP
jgi:photosystem II stability/assembly factor-like uncharacterized protein